MLPNMSVHNDVMQLPHDLFCPKKLSSPIRFYCHALFFRKGRLQPLVFRTLSQVPSLRLKTKATTSTIMATLVSNKLGCWRWWFVAWFQSWCGDYAITHCIAIASICHYQGPGNYTSQGSVGKQPLSTKQSPPVFGFGTSTRNQQDKVVHPQRRESTKGQGEICWKKGGGERDCVQYL